MTWQAQPAEFAPALLAIQESPPAKLPRAVLYVVASLCVLMLAWAVFGKLDIVAVADGKLVPQTYVKIVQPVDAGVISEILVAEGDHVRAGQTLIRLDPTLADAEGKSVAQELALRRLTLRRIDAELAGTRLQPDAGDDPALLAQVQQQGAQRVIAYQDALAQETAQRRRLEQDLKAAQEIVRKLKVTLPSYEQSAAANRRLVAEGFMSPLAGSEKEREAIEKAQDLKSQLATADGIEEAIRAQDKKIAALTSSYRTQLLGEKMDTVAALGRLEQDSAKSRFRQQQLELKAPQDGIVKDLATTSRGAVVQPGMVLLSLVPQGETLVAEVQVRNEDIAFVRKGQAVQLKLAAYPFQKYGLMEGTVLTVGADAQGGTAGYKALVRLASQSLRAQDDGTWRSFPLEPGMQVSAEIHQGERTVMEYLMSPISKALQEAGRER